MSVLAPMASKLSELKESRAKARAEIAALRQKLAPLLQTEARLDQQIAGITAGSTKKLG